MEKSQCTTSTRTNCLLECPVFQAFLDRSWAVAVYPFHCFLDFRPNSVQPVLAVLDTSVAPETFDRMPRGRPMTEAEWLAADSPQELLLWLGAKSRRRRSLRKNGLFIVACAERISSFMRHAVTISGLELAERMAEGVADGSEGERYLAEFGAACPPGEPGPHEAARVVSFEAMKVLLPHRMGQSSEKLAVSAAQSCAGVFYAANDISRAIQETGTHAALLRDVIGNPFRPVTLDTTRLTSTVVSLADGIYQERAFDRLPILADALQDAGCDNDDILNHCRGVGPHVRGCWVVDAVLGKK
jgi:hypothetical protein